MILSTLGSTTSTTLASHPDGITPFLFLFAVILFPIVIGKLYLFVFQAREDTDDVDS